MKYNLLGQKDFGWISYMVWNEFFKPAPIESDSFVLPRGIEVGDKVDNKPVKLASVSSFEGAYGNTFIYSFIDGNVRYKWFTSID